MIKPNSLKKSNRLLKKLRLGPWQQLVFDIKAKARTPLTPEQIDTVMDSLLDLIEAEQLSTCLFIGPKGLYAGIQSERKYGAMTGADIMVISRAIEQTKLFTDLEHSGLYDAYWQEADLEFECLG